MLDDGRSTRLDVAREHLHHHAASILLERPELRQAVLAAVVGDIQVDTTERRRGGERYLGVTAQSLNVALKRRFRAVGGWQFEVTFRDGVIFGNLENDARVEGFDIARFEERANLARLWSVCFGRRPLRDGPEIWERFLYQRPHLRSVAADLMRLGIPGEDLSLDPSEPTLLGEIQFGNWALAHRDIMKLLAAAAAVDVDLFVYIVADGDLAGMISQGTVNFDRTRDILREFESVVKVPTWLVGVDLVTGADERRTSSPRLDS